MRNLNRFATGAPRAIAKHAQRNAVAYIALFVALAGSSYAAVSISGTQIRNHTINPVKFNPRFINGNVRAWALVGANGHVMASAGRPRVALAAGLPSEYRIFWGVKVGHCATVASVDGADSRPTETVPGLGVRRWSWLPVTRWSHCCAAGEGRSRWWIRIARRAGRRRWRSTWP